MIPLSAGDFIAVANVSAKLVQTIPKVINALRGLPASPERRDTIVFLESILEQLLFLKDQSLLDSLDEDSQSQLLVSVKAVEKIVQNFLDKVSQAKTGIGHIWLVVKQFPQSFSLQYDWDKKVSALDQTLNQHMRSISLLLNRQTLVTSKNTFDRVDVLAVQQMTTHSLIVETNGLLVRMENAQKLFTKTAEKFKRSKKSRIQEGLSNLPNHKKASSHRAERSRHAESDARVFGLHGIIKAGHRIKETMVSNIPFTSSPFGMGQQRTEEEFGSQSFPRTPLDVPGSFSISVRQGCILHVDSSGRNNSLTRGLVIDDNNTNAIEKEDTPTAVLFNEELVTADNIWDYLADPVPSHCRPRWASDDTDSISSEVPSIDWEGVYKNNDDSPEDWQFWRQIQEHEREQEECLQPASPDTADRNSAIPEAHSNDRLEEIATSPVMGDDEMRLDPGVGDDEVEEVEGTTNLGVLGAIMQAMLLFG